MSVDRIFLIEVEFKEFVMITTLEVLESKPRSIVKLLFENVSEKWTTYELTF
jgi:hypothetical protein